MAVSAWAMGVSRITEANFFGIRDLNISVNIISIHPQDATGFSITEDMIEHWAKIAHWDADMKNICRETAEKINTLSGEQKRGEYHPEASLIAHLAQSAANSQAGPSEPSGSSDEKTVSSLITKRLS
jgi:hypothetical protein